MLLKDAQTPERYPVPVFTFGWGDFLAIIIIIIAANRHGGVGIYGVPEHAAQHGVFVEVHETRAVVAAVVIRRIDADLPLCFSSATRS